MTLSLRAASARAALALVATSAAVLAAGCPDPQQTFDDFGERYEALDPQQGSSSSGPVEGCQVPEPGGDVDGTYLFALSAGQIVPNKPLLFDATVTIVEGASGPELNLVLQPLGTPYRADETVDPLAPVGSPIDLGSYPIAADGTFSAELPEITVGGQANSITPRDLTATVTLAGQICANPPGQGEGGVELGFFCGQLSGNVTEPIKLVLEAAKNTFTFIKYDGELPGEEEIVYDCAKDVAAPFL
jgi:hypothetical protein